MLPLTIKRVLWSLGVLTGGAGLLGAIAVFLLVDDWSRDLSQNTAATDPDHPDPLLRDTKTSAPPGIVLKALESFAQKHSHWRIQSQETVGTAETRVRLVRATRLWRFQDDVRVEVAGEGSTRISIASASRVGRADFGQNPRNIRELNRWLRERLPEGPEN